MNFADIRFWGYLFLAFGIVLIVRFPLSRWTRVDLGSYDRVSLSLVGLFLLGCVSIQTLVIFAVVSVVTFVGLHLLVRFEECPDRRMRWLWLLIPLQILPLFWYKYADFVGNGILNLDQSSLVSIAIPVGISFYTFQLIAFAVDTLVHRNPLPSPVASLNFAGFFPQIVAGPIERRDSLLPQLVHFRYSWNREAVQNGVSWIVLGVFFKRCMADNLALNSMTHQGDNPFTIWLDTVLFGFRIYFDFSGYSMMALGVAACLGIRLTLNFRSPYCATSIGDFWRRWHVTLSTWFRDYLYIPLGGSRTKRWALNIMIVFVVSGIWHGAGWNFILWGALHGLLLTGQRLCGSISIPKILGYLGTHLGVFLAWLCFYETNTSALFRKFGQILNPFAYDSVAIRSFTNSMLSPGGVHTLAILGMVFTILVVEWFSLKKGDEPYRFFRTKAAAMVMIVLTVFLAPTSNNDFIYFAF